MLKIVLVAVILVVGVLAIVINRRIGDADDYEDRVEKKELQARLVDILSIYTVSKARNEMIEAELDGNDRQYIAAGAVLEYWKIKGRRK